MTRYLGIIIVTKNFTKTLYVMATRTLLFCCPLSPAICYMYTLYPNRLSLFILLGGIQCLYPFYQLSFLLAVSLLDTLLDRLVMFTTLFSCPRSRLIIFLVPLSSRPCLLVSSSPHSFRPRPLASLFSHLSSSPILASL